VHRQKCSGSRSSTHFDGQSLALRYFGGIHG
jgi:hypothetical protein